MGTPDFPARRPCLHLHIKQFLRMLVGTDGFFKQLGCLKLFILGIYYESKLLDRKSSYLLRVSLGTWLILDFEIRIHYELADGNHDLLFILRLCESVHGWQMTEL